MAQALADAHPQNHKAWRELGHVLLRVGQKASQAQEAFEKAAALNSTDAQTLLGLANACLLNGQTDVAVAHLQSLLAGSDLPEPVAMSAAQSLIKTLIQQGRIDEARQACEHARATCTAEQMPPWLSSAQWKLAACWWQAIESQNQRIRRPRQADAAWLKRSFQDDRFASVVNRTYAQRIRVMSEGQVARQLESQWSQSPVDLGAQMFIIERLNGERLGIASFVTIDADSKRAEFIIGFAGEPPHGNVVLETSLLLTDFVFARAGFHKLVVAIYSDNPRLEALKSTLTRLGFVVEGIQRQHVRLPEGQYIDIHLLGGLRDEVLNHPLMRKCATRFLAHAWDDTRSTPP